MLKVAVGQADITPDEPMPLLGYPTRIGLSEGVLDRILVTALVLEVGKDKICMLSYDIVMLEKEHTDEIRNTVSQKFGVDFDKIFCSFTHTHSAPQATKKWTTGFDASGYITLITDKSLEAVSAAYEAGFKEADAFMVKEEIEGIYGNRNHKDAVSDKSLNILKFKDKDGSLVAAMVNMTCHATVLGPVSNLVSGDIFGYVRNGLQEKWGTTVLMINGAAGDMSNRQYRQGNQAEELARCGEELLAQILAFGNEMPVSLGDKVDVTENFHNINYVPDKAAIQAMYDDLKERLKTETNYDTIKLYKSALAGEAKLSERGPVDIIVDSYIYKFGDVTIITVPAELFSKFGMKIKEAAKTPFAIIAGYTNHLTGYFVEQEEYGKYFESFVTPISKGFPEEFAKKTCELF